MRHHVRPHHSTWTKQGTSKLIKPVMIQIMTDREQMDNLECFNYLGSLIKKKKRIPFIFIDESTGTCTCLRLDLYMSYLQGCAFNTRL
jgi:hypothetical protein